MNETDGGFHGLSFMLGACVLITMETMLYYETFGGSLSLAISFSQCGMSQINAETSELTIDYLTLIEEFSLRLLKHLRFLWESCWFHLLHNIKKICFSFFNTFNL